MIGSALAWLVALLLLHILSFGPAVYASSRGWLDPRVETSFEVFYFSEIWLINSTIGKSPHLTDPYVNYINYCDSLGRRHKGP
jgi:hypothetical protein